MNTPPTIGITLDAETLSLCDKQPCQLLRQNSFTAVTNNGGIPIALPHCLSAVDHYLDLIDGLIVSGDIDPTMLFTEEQTPDYKLQRLQFEQRLIEGAIKRRMPLLGICGGMQILAGLQGATLLDLTKVRELHSVQHLQPEPYSEPAHQVLLNPNSRLRSLVGSDSYFVNSVHRQSVMDNLPSTVVVSARATDDVIEAIEIPLMPFCMGVQWHPEYQLGPEDRRLFQALITASEGHINH